MEHKKYYDLSEELQNRILEDRKNGWCNPYRAKDEDAIRRKQDWDRNKLLRPAYIRDCEKIMHTPYYNRYADKTQVFSFYKNDDISRRALHVQLVSRIARNIGGLLGLNVDLIEAIALGHDIGHTPLGHTGEAFLNEISLRELGEYFSHNIQSVRDLMFIENNGNGLNLTIQVYDGIMCHNGEMLESIYRPVSKTKEEFLREYNLAYKDIKTSRTFRPMTLEGCVVRISDIIGYIGRDIEDAIMLGIIKREELPDSISNVLGTTNREIINTIVMDIVNNSLNKPYIKLSDDVFKALFDLKKFNYEHIYKYGMTDEMREYYSIGMNKLFTRYLDDIRNKNYESDIFTIFLNGQSDKYNLNTSDKRKVIDFIAGMTDDFFMNEVDNINK